MKKPFVSDLTGEQTITGFFLVHAKEIRNTKEGKPYLRLDLGDRTGNIETRMWTKFEVVVQDIARDDFVKVEGRVELYRDKPQLSLLQIRKAKPEEIELADFLPHTKEDVEKMYAQLLEYGSAIENPWLQKLVLGILSDPAIAPRFKRRSGSKSDAPCVSRWIAGARGRPVRACQTSGSALSRVGSGFVADCGHTTRRGQAG